MMTADGTSTLIRGARVFDGQRLHPADTVLVADGTVAGIGPGLGVPPGAEVIDGRGGTLLPGLIDCHVHAGDVRALGQALAFGVTTELDMFSGPDLAAERRALAARRDDVADIRTATQGATSAGSTLARLIPGLPAVAGPQDAAAFVAARAAEGADYLKIYLEDPAWYGSPALSAATVRALVAAAHSRGMLAIAHADSAAMARMFLQAGGDALAHVLADLDVSPAFLAALRRRPAFVIATLRATAVLSTAHAAEIEAYQRELARHPRLGPYLDPLTRATFTRPDLLADARAHGAAAACAGGRLDFDGALRSVAALHQAGIPVLAGTDTNYPGPQHDSAILTAYTGHGITLHHELALLVRAGLSPAAALAAATSVPARLFGLTDRGRIAPGLRADLLLVDGDPCADITATRNIAAIWRNGTRLHRQPQPAPHAAMTAAPAADPGKLGPGILAPSGSRADGSRVAMPATLAGATAARAHRRPRRPARTRRLRRSCASQGPDHVAAVPRRDQAELRPWRTQVRIRAAIRLVASGATVNAAARAVSYRKPSSFINAFRRAIHADTTLPPTVQ
jgi:imidazolonepropionase-like amidohydrolase